MKIVSKFTTGILSSIVNLVVRKKLGVNADIKLNAVHATIGENGKTHIHLDVDAELDKEELTKLLKGIGI